MNNFNRKLTFLEMEECPPSPLILTNRSSEDAVSKSGSENYQDSVIRQITTSHNQYFTRSVIFNDSKSDMGNNKARTRISPEPGLRLDRHVHTIRGFDNIYSSFVTSTRNIFKEHTQNYGQELFAVRSKSTFKSTILRELKLIEEGAYDPIFFTVNAKKSTIPYNLNRIDVVSSNFRQRNPTTKIKALLDAFKTKPNISFVDDEFPCSVHSLTHLAPKPLPKVCGSVEWIKLFYLYKDYEICVFDEHGFHDKDLVAGIAESYQFVYSLSCIAASGLIKEVFAGQKINPEGLYHIDLYEGGVKRTIIVDDFVPCYSEGMRRYEPLFAKIRPRGNKVSIWPQLLIKCLAKLLGSFEKVLLLDLYSFIDLLTPFPILEQNSLSSRALGVLHTHLSNNHIVISKANTLNRRIYLNHKQRRI